MEHPFDTMEFEHEGYTFIAEFFYDGDSGPPWDECEGHGPVREVSTNDYGRPDKKPGERILNGNPGRHDTVYAYDWAAALKLAKKDGWNTEPYDAPNKAARAVQADFDYLAGWVNDEWHYCGVVVTLLRDGEKDEAYTDSLWCVETHNDYHKEAAKEQCASSVVYQLKAEAEEEAARVAQQQLDAEIEANTKD